MSDIEKKPCEICGKLISTWPASWARHAAMHTAPVQTETGELVVDKTPAPVEKPVVTKAPKKSVAPRSEEDRVRLERALAAQDEALKAPEIFVGSTDVDEHMELRRAYAPDTIDGADAKGNPVPSPRVAMFGDARKKDAYASKGWVPVFNDHGDQVTNGGGDCMFTITRSLYDAREETFAKESRMRTAQAHRKAATVNTAKDIPLETQQGDEKYSTEVVLETKSMGDNK